MGVYQENHVGPVTVNENERIGSYAMEVEAQQENFDLFSVTNTPPRVVNNDSSQTPVTVAWNGTPNSNYNDYPYNTLFRNNPSYTTKNRTPLLSSRGVNLFGKHPRDEYNDDNDNERVKRQKVQKENEELTARVKELETEKDGMKEEHTEALATKQVEIDNLKTANETIQNEKEDADQMIQELRQEKETIQMQKEES